MTRATAPTSALPAVDRAVLASPRCGGSWLVELGHLVPLGTVPAGARGRDRPGPGGVASA